MIDSMTGANETLKRKKAVNLGFWSMKELYRSFAALSDI